MNLDGTITSIGIPTIVGMLIYIGKKLQLLEDLRRDVAKIKTNLRIVTDHLTSNSSDFNHRELQDYSPVQLTIEGKKLIRSLRFDKVFAAHQTDFLDYISGENPRLKYDVEAAAIRSITALYDQDYMEFLKVFLYNNPRRNLQNIAPTLGIYVRDKYLAEHPEITE